MKRPLGTAGLLFLATVAVVYLFGLIVAILFVAANFVVVFVFLIKKYTDKKPIVLIMSIIVTFCVAAIIVATVDIEKSKLIEQKLTYQTGDATVLIKAKLDSGKFIADLLHFNNESFDNVSVGLYLKTECVPGDIVNCRISLYDPTEFDSGVANLLSYNASVIEEFSTQKQQNTVYFVIGELQELIKNTIETQVEGERGSIAAAVITGDKALIPTQNKIEFDRAGTSHIFVVSGLHVSFMLGFIYSFLKRIRLNRFITFMLVALSAGFFMLLYGLSVSVVRASLIMLVSVFASLISKKSDPLTTLGLCAVAILLFTPRLAVNVSFLLSFGCCFAIFAVNPLLEQLIDTRISKKQNRLNDTLKSFTVSFAITAVTLPVATLFGTPISILSPFANLFVVGLMPWLMSAIVGVVLFGNLLHGSFFAHMFSVLTEAIIYIITFICRLFSYPTFATISSSSAYFKVSVIFATIVVVFALTVFKNKLKFFVVIATIILPFFVGYISKAYYTNQDTVVTLYYGNSVIISNNDKQNLVLLNPNLDNTMYLKSYLTLNGFDNIQNVAMFGDYHYAMYSVQNAFPDSELLTLTDETKNDSTLFFRFNPEQNVVYVEQDGFTLKINRSSHSTGDLELFVSNGKIQYSAKPVDGKNVVQADKVYDYGENVILYLKDDLSFKVIFE